MGCGASKPLAVHPSGPGALRGAPEGAGGAAGADSVNMQPSHGGSVIYGKPMGAVARPSPAASPEQGKGVLGDNPEESKGGSVIFGANLPVSKAGWIPGDPIPYAPAMAKTEIVRVPLEGGRTLECHYGCVRELRRNQRSDCSAGPRGRMACFETCAECHMPRCGPLEPGMGRKEVRGGGHDR